MISTKKREPTSPAGMIRDIKDHPKWREALEIQRQLQVEATAIEQEMLVVEGVRPVTPQEHKIKNLVKEIFARISGGPEPIKAELSPVTV